MSDSSTDFHRASPILRVRDLATSVDHYRRVLGFKLGWETPHMVSVLRGDASLMLCQGHQGRPGTWIWIGVADTDVLEREYRASGATIRLPPTNYPWSYEMHVEDPDGHVIRLGADPKKDRPFSEWVVWYPVRTDE